MTLIENVVKAFFLGRSVKATEQLAGGLINQTFRIDFEDAGCFILQKVNTDVFQNIKAVHENMGVVSDYLNKSDYRYAFPIPVDSKNGQNWLELDNATWRMLPFVPETYSTGKIHSEEMARNASECLGHFHASTIDLDPSKLAITIPDFHSGVLRINQFEEAVRKSDKAGIKLVAKIHKHFHVLEKWDQLNKKVSKRAVHFDTKIENFLFKKGTEEVAALIDLDTLMPGSILSDVGDLIRSFCHHNLKYRDSILDGYLSKMNGHITEHERRFLTFSGSALTLLQALRFLTDHLNGDVYYQTKYEGQNLERAEHQFSVYQDLKS